MRSTCSILFLLTVILMPAGLGAQPPSVVLPDGGIQFQDDTILNSAAKIDPPATATVAVDCGSGDSINEALETPAVDLTVEIDGICNENVVIQRDNVTLKGSDEATDGINGVVTGAEFEPPVVRIVESTNVRIENLTIANGARHGVTAILSRGEMDQCTLTGNSNWGIVATQASRLDMTNMTISANSGGGVAASRGTTLTCDLCDVSGNGTDKWAVYSLGAAYVYVTNSTISGDKGVTAVMSGFVYGQDTTITATDLALHSTEQGDINWWGRDAVVDISGDILVEFKAFLWMFSVNQTAGSNQLTNDSTLTLLSSTLLGLDLATFSNGDAEDSTVGDITCASGSDFYCHGSTVPTTSTCGLCPVAVRPSETGAGPAERDGSFRKLPDRFPRKVMPFTDPGIPFSGDLAGGRVLELP